MKYRLETSLIHLLHRAHQKADELFARHASTSSVTPRQLAFLLAVAEGGAVSQRDIISATGIDRSSTAELVAKLHHRGLISRSRRRGNARTDVIRITKLGQQIIEEASAGARAAEAALRRMIPVPSRRLVAQALKRIVR